MWWKKLDKLPLWHWFCNSPSLIKIGLGQNPTATIFLKSDWDKFILEETTFSENLMVTVNPTSISDQWPLLLLWETRKCWAIDLLTNLMVKLGWKDFCWLPIYLTRKSSQKLVRNTGACAIKVSRLHGRDRRDHRFGQWIWYCCWAYFQAFLEERKEINKDKTPFPFEMLKKGRRAYRLAC